MMHRFGALLQRLQSEGIQWIESEPEIDGVIIIEAFSLEKHCSQEQLKRLKLVRAWR